MRAASTGARRIGWALAISLLLHLAATFGPGIEVPEYRPDPVLEATLRRLPPALPDVHKPRPRASKTAAAKPRNLPPPTPAAAPSAIAAPPPAPPPAPADRTPSPAAPATPAPATPAAAAADAESAPPPEAPQEIPMPELAELHYLLYKGLDRFIIGKAEHTWKRDGTHYAITQVAEASGIVSLFFSGRHVQVSAGEITPQGLRPDSYRVERGQGADKTDSAQFDWDAGTLTIGTGGNTRHVPLPAGTQDLLSFAYQLAFAPPQAGTTELYITNGRKLDKYAYRTLGEEAIATPMGQLKTLHIERLHQAGEENTEIWLATEYHYLPVKIRQTDKEGGVIEQTAAAIKLR